MNAREAASVTALVLAGVSKEEAAQRWGHDPEFSSFWDDTVADIAQQREENPDIEFDIPTDI